MYLLLVNKITPWPLSQAFHQGLLYIRQKFMNNHLCITQIARACQCSQKCSTFVLRKLTEFKYWYPDPENRTKQVRKIVQVGGWR